MLDENHRVTAAKHIYGLEEQIQFRVYLEFPAQEAKIIADGKCEARDGAKALTGVGVHAICTGTFEGHVLDA